MIVLDAPGPVLAALGGQKFGDFTLLLLSVVQLGQRKRGRLLLLLGAGQAGNLLLLLLLLSEDRVLQIGQKVRIPEHGGHQLLLVQVLEGMIRCGRRRRNAKVLIRLISIHFLVGSSISVDAEAAAGVPVNGHLWRWRSHLVV